MSVITNSSEIKEQSDESLLHIRQTIHQGILPPPEQLEKYAQSHPDAVKIILEMAVRQQQIDFELQKINQERYHFCDKENFDLARKRVEMNGRFARQGQWFAFVLMICFFILLGYMITTYPSGAVAVGFIVPAITAIGQIVYLFLHGKKPPKEQGE